MLKSQDCSNWSLWQVIFNTGFTALGFTAMKYWGSDLTKQTRFLGLLLLKLSVMLSTLLAFKKH